MTIEHDTKSPRPVGAGASDGPAASRAAGLPHADELIDELLPEEVDWEHLVRSYPWPALAVAAAAGFYLAVSRGPLLVTALGGWAGSEMTRRFNDLLGEDLL